ncbi:MAG: radical SAM protein [Candidatus Omnitrophica bacterium]|nr:radical SAM protein [Candidatus Omnitrophota bacterium]
METLNKHQENIPKACILLLTLGCSLRCRMCRLWQNDESGIRRPSQADWKNFILSLGKFAAPDFNMIFGGGEPLLFPDKLIELISFSNRNGFRTSLATSGYFIDAGCAQRLVEAGLNYIALTLYSLNKETHDYLRGKPDSHKKLMDAITFLDKFRSSLEIAIDTVIMAPNLTELLALADWVKKDHRIRSVFFQAVVQPFHSAPQDEWYRRDEFAFLWPKALNEVNMVIDSLIKLKDPLAQGAADKINNPISQLELFKSYFRNPNEFVKKYSCNVTNGNSFTVSPDGSIKLCPYMESIGNIRDADIKDIWYSVKAQERRGEMASCKKNCHHIINCWYEEEKIA